MMDCTDRHERYFLRLISKHTRLYTEMVTTGALLHGDRERFLGFDALEHPIGVQLGGSDAAALAACARMAEQRGYDEVNLNVGCPSPRVQAGRFGACLMAEPALVAECVARMRAAVDIPVTVKTRIGVDSHDSYDELGRFVETIALAGCRTIIVHARKAWLKGLSPKQNREVPPLRYDMVRRLKTDFPRSDIVLNGGITRITEVAEHLRVFDGVMLGREAYRNPYMLAPVDQMFFGETGPAPARNELVSRYLPYVQSQLEQGVYLSHMTRHMLGLYQGQPGAKAWRRYLSQHACKPGAGVEVIEGALSAVAGYEHVTQFTPAANV
jgi:tRNA-dihydrouridine synthase A